ncbi:hypothetical protein CSC17_5901 (plasmid) [Klebsiella oxytoca]|nr:hypothetical protein CSC17_5901 [Klebsiella oxytoca]
MCLKNELQVKKNLKPCFTNKKATTTRHHCAPDDNFHGQEMFKTTIQLPDREPDDEPRHRA